MSENDHRAELHTVARLFATQRHATDDETSEQHDADAEARRLLRRLFDRTAPDTDLPKENS